MQSRTGRARVLTLGTLLFVLAVPFLAGASDRPLPNAKMTFGGWLGGIGIGYSSVDGTLYLNDEAYPITIVGMTALEAGLAYVSGTADVWMPEDPRAIQGRYRAFVFAATVGGGGHVTLLQNRPGSYIEMTATTYGLSISLGPSAIQIFVHGVERR